MPEAILIFLLPPSREELKRRLLGKEIRSEGGCGKTPGILGKELASIDRYDYVVVNDILENACRKVAAIITAEEARADRGYWREQF